jgi:hypothetical protein
MGIISKKIADSIIKMKKIKLKTKYIYGSRKVWRIPSYIEEIDEGFFLQFGNFTGVSNFNSLLDALDIDESYFETLFPELMYLKERKKISKSELNEAIVCFKNSNKYKEYLLNKAKLERKIVLEYLKQNINLDEKFEFVEYWGRGYTQDCLSRLLQIIAGKPIDVPFYYVRSIYPSQNHSIRYNYTSNTSSLLFAEAIFANIPYQSIREYKYVEDGKVVPVILPHEYDKHLFNTMNRYLVQFCQDFYKLNLIDEDTLERDLFSFALAYFQSNSHKDQYILENIGHLKYAVELNAPEMEFAPAFNLGFIWNRFRGRYSEYYTRSMKMSLARSSELINNIYRVKNHFISKRNIPRKMFRFAKKCLKRF